MLGPELIINGEFTTDLSGWNVSGVIWNAGAAEFFNNDYMYQNPSVTVEQQYIVQFDYFSTKDNPEISPGIVTFSFGAQIPENISATSNSPVHASFLYTCTQADIDLGVIVYFSQGSNYLDIDNVSLKAIIPNTVIQTTFLVGSDPAGDIQLINAGTNDDFVPIYYELETQDIEFGDRSHLKKISNRFGVVSQLAQDSSVQFKQDEKDYKSVLVSLDNRVSIIKSIDLEGRFFNLKWLGNTTNVSPVFEGFYLEDIKDWGMSK